MRLLAARKIEVDRLITHRLPLEEVARGFRLVMDGKEAVKVIIRPHRNSGNSD
jgi:L-iditol 2-dehydrogenase